MCQCEIFLTEYGTQVCKLCGLEITVGLPTYDKYTTNCPLIVGYSRVSRVKTILDQLFRPFLYGTPSQVILFKIIENKLRFSSGGELLRWLNDQPVKNKKYTCCHYYFARANKDYTVPTPPSRDQIWSIVKEFANLEFRYHSQSTYQSFFSYNWLIRKLLERFGLTHYIQFIKPIKCKARRHMYYKMYTMFTSIAYTRPVTREHVSDSPISPFSLRDYAYEYLRQLSSNSPNHGTGSPPNMPVAPT